MVNFMLTFLVPKGKVATVKKELRRYKDADEQIISLKMTDEEHVGSYSDKIDLYAIVSANYEESMMDFIKECEYIQKYLDTRLMCVNNQTNYETDYSKRQEIKLTIRDTDVVSAVTTSYSSCRRIGIVHMRFINAALQFSFGKMPHIIMTVQLEK